MTNKEKTDKIDLLLKQVYIDFEKGDIRWLYSGTGRTKDRIIGSIISSGYRSVWFNGNRIQYHQVMFYAKNGYIPKSGRVIDHIDRDKLNNKINNLMDVSLAENAQNKGLNKNNTSGYMGVSFVKANSNWHAHIYRDKKRFFIGVFDTKEEAAKARCDVEANPENKVKYRKRKTQ